VTISADRPGDILTLLVEDDGLGMRAFPAEVVEPSYTTKPEKQTGMGLPLFRRTAESADGGLMAAESRFGGVALVAMMRLNHHGRGPLGDIAATFESLACTNPELDLQCRLILDGSDQNLLRWPPAATAPMSTLVVLENAKKFADEIGRGLDNLDGTA